MPVFRNGLTRKIGFMVVLAAVFFGSQHVSFTALAQSDSVPTQEATAEATAPVGEVAILVPQILETYPHDPAAFTQGLLLENGLFYESTGLYGQSTLREVEPETGEVLRSVSLPPEIFAEGLELVGDRLLQLTWQEGIVYSYDFETFELLDSFDYAEEGWGICYDGEYLYTSDGSTQLIVRDPETLAEQARLDVLLQGQAVPQINELECVGDSIYANVWQTNAILRIDKTTGQVTGLIDARGLLTPAQRGELTSSGAVLNGIAYDPESETFYITGKLWHWMFEVEFVEVATAP